MTLADWVRAVPSILITLIGLYYLALMFIPSASHCLKCGRRQTVWARDNCGGLCGHCFWELRD